ncbi:MAG: STAS domain-containing protein [Anaerolineae bacterium]|nr:STAS domain-containing protein [Anaerolineae bacterium]
MNITEKEHNGVVVFTLEGRIDTQGAVDLDLALQTSATEGHNQMVLDMAEVKYINSSALRTLADIVTQNRDNGGDLKLAALSQKVKRVFEIIGFDNFFEIYENIDSAVAAFKAG